MIDKAICDWCNSTMEPIGDWYAGRVLKCTNCDHERIVVDFETADEIGKGYV